MIAGAIHGKPIGGVVASSKKPKSKDEKKPVVPNGYVLDKNGIPYKKVANIQYTTFMLVYNVRTSYNTTATITGVLPNGTSIIYDGAYCINCYRWITYIANNGKTLYSNRRSR